MFWDMKQQQQNADNSDSKFYLPEVGSHVW